VKNEANTTVCQTKRASEFTVTKLCDLHVSFVYANKFSLLKFRFVWIDEGTFLCYVTALRCKTAPDSWANSDISPSYELRVTRFCNLHATLVDPSKSRLLKFRFVGWGNFCVLRHSARGAKRLLILEQTPISPSNEPRVTRFCDLYVPFVDPSKSCLLKFRFVGWGNFCVLRHSACGAKRLLILEQTPISPSNDLCVTRFCDLHVPFVDPSKSCLLKFRFVGWGNFCVMFTCFTMRCHAKRLLILEQTSMSPGYELRVTKFCDLPVTFVGASSSCLLKFRFVEWGLFFLLVFV
jgi:hypothetical protein